MCDEENRQQCPYLDEDELWRDENARCPGCPVVQLERAFASDKGRLIQNAQEISGALAAGFHVDWAELGADDFLAVGVLVSERQRYDQEIRGEEPQPTNGSQQ